MIYTYMIYKCNIYIYDVYIYSVYIYEIFVVVHRCSEKSFYLFIYLFSLKGFTTGDKNRILPMKRRINLTTRPKRVANPTGHCGSRSHTSYFCIAYGMRPGALSTNSCSFDSQSQLEICQVRFSSIVDLHWLILEVLG